MKKEYDFSKGKKRKFYVPEDEIELPIYLNKKNRIFYSHLAGIKKKSVTELVNAVLQKDKELIDVALDK